MVVDEVAPVDGHLLWYGASWVPCDIQKWCIQITAHQTRLRLLPIVCVPIVVIQGIAHLDGPLYLQLPSHPWVNSTICPPPGFAYYTRRCN
jgi:hypothetical protein